VNSVTGMEREARQEGITQCSSSDLALFLSQCGSRGLLTSSLARSLSLLGSLDNDAGTCTQSVQRGEGDLSLSLRVRSFLQGNVR